MENADYCRTSFRQNDQYLRHESASGADYVIALLELGRALIKILLEVGEHFADFVWSSQIRERIGDGIVVL